MSKEAIVIPQQLQQYINQCLDDAELKSLKVIPVKIFDYAVNLRDYYDFERREFRRFESKTIAVTDIKQLTEKELAQYKKERANKFYKYYPALRSEEPAVTSSAAVAAAAASVYDVPDYQPLVELLRRQRQASRAEAASSAQPSAMPEKTSTVPNPRSADTAEASIKPQPPLPAGTKIKLHRHASSAQTSSSEKQQSAKTDSFKSILSTSMSSANMNATTPRTDERTPLLRK